MGAWSHLDAETQASQPAGPRPHPCGFTFITPDPLLHHDAGANCEGTALPNCSPHPHSAEEQTKAPLRAGGQSHTALVTEICMRTGLFQSPGHTLWPGPHQPELSEIHSEARS